ncbi:hypothetical protein K523DRAFT_321436 [Schizophyllum commune Tattone D]|nr:hypothetical protein K523DRAFT_322508 [Schizophyllum commune Tattone D]KAI5828305.1 hypothetical protein K523DRAFT_321436 [Schizophyllum commune Tattone D]
MWFSFKSIFQHAFERLDAPEDMGYTDGEDLLYAAFLAINDQVPNIMKIIEDVADEDWDFFCSKLDMGRSRARNEDTSTLTTKASWYDGNIPTKTRNRGFKNAFCSKQLCPVTLDMNKPEVRKPLEDGHLVPSPSDSPALLYADEKYDPDDPMEGYLKNKYLVYGVRAILLGPSAACGRAGSTAKKSGNAHRHGITSISFPFIAYVACLHHFVCTDQETFSAGGASAGWPYAEFYRSILGVVACMSDGQKAGLIKWWNEQVFGGIPRELLAGTVQGEPSQMERMKVFLRTQNSAPAAAASA